MSGSPVAARAGCGARPLPEPGCTVSGQSSAAAGAGAVSGRVAGNACSERCCDGRTYSLRGPASGAGAGAGAAVGGGGGGGGGGRGGGGGGGGGRGGPADRRLGDRSSRRLPGDGHPALEALEPL